MADSEPAVVSTEVPPAATETSMETSMDVEKSATDAPKPSGASDEPTMPLPAETKAEPEKVEVAPSVTAAPPAAAVTAPVETQKMTTRQYLDSTVVPILLQALSAVAKERPQDPIGFLADFLTKNKDKYQTHVNGGKEG